MKKRIWMLIFSCLLLGLIVFGVIILTTSSSEVLKRMEVDEKYHPQFVDIDEGNQVLEPLVFGSIGWSVSGTVNFLFAIHGNYVVRYNIKENKVDRIVDLGESYKGWPHTISCSKNGTYCISHNSDFYGDLSRNYFLIDMEKKTTKLILDIYDEKIISEVIKEMIPKGVQSEVNEELLKFNMTVSNPCCDLVAWGMTGVKFANKNGESKVLNCLNYYSDLGGYYIFNEKKMGALIPSSDNQEDFGLLGYYKFVVIDVVNDKIIQEYVLNEK